MSYLFNTIGIQDYVVVVFMTSVLYDRCRYTGNARCYYMLNDTGVKCACDLTECVETACCVFILICYDLPVV